MNPTAPMQYVPGKGLRPAPPPRGQSPPRPSMPPAPYSKPEVHEPPIHTYDAEADARAIAEALKQPKESMKGALAAVLGARPREHVAGPVADAYERAVGSPLRKDIEAATKGAFRDLAVALVTPMAKYWAQCLYDSMHGAGTDDGLLIDVVAQSVGPDMDALRSAWQQTSGKPLAERIKSDTSGDYCKALVAAVSANRAPGIVDEARVESDADVLWKAGEGRLGTDDAKFIELFTTRSAEHLQRVSEAYSRKHSRTLEMAVKSETSFNFERVLVALMTPRGKHFARRLGPDPSKDVVVRVFGMNDRAALRQISEQYVNLFNKSLIDMIKSKTKGGLNALAVALLS